MKKEFNAKGAKRGALVPAKEAKVVKTIRFDMDIVAWAVTEASKQHMPYQTFINRVLRATMEQSMDFNAWGALAEHKKIKRKLEKRLEDFKKEFLKEISEELKEAS